MKKIHYGWFVCLGCALLFFCTSGLCVNAFTIYQPYILRQNGLTNAQSSALITVRNLFIFVSMFLTGKYYRLFSLRTGMTLAGLVSALGFVLFGLAKNYAMYCLAAVAIGFGNGLGTMIPMAIILEHWFTRKRTFAISICSAVSGLSTLGIPTLLTWTIETYGLRTTFCAEGVFVALLALLTFLLVRDRPEQKGLLPYGAELEGEETRAARRGSGLRWENWLLLIPMLLLLGAMTNVGYSHLTVLVSGEGFGSHTTAIAITLSGVMMTVCKCVYGFTAEKLGTYRTNWIFGSVLLAGMVLCCVMRGSVLILFAAMCAYGGGLALTTVGLTAWAGDLSSPEQYDGTVRRFQLGYAAGGLIFSTLPGVLADRFGGSYVPAYMFFTGCALFVVLSIQWTYRHAGGEEPAFLRRKALHIPALRFHGGKA